MIDGTREGVENRRTSMKKEIQILISVMVLFLSVACEKEDITLSPYSEEMNVPDSIQVKQGEDPRLLNQGLYGYVGKSEKTAIFRLMKPSDGEWKEMAVFRQELKPGGFILCDFDHDDKEYALKLEYADSEQHVKFEQPLEIPFLEFDGFGAEYLNDPILLDSEECILSFNMSHTGVSTSYEYSMLEFPEKAPYNDGQRILLMKIK